jgi:uncharacterized protein (UPF0335 family)
MLPEKLNVQVKRTSSGRWTASGEDVQAEGESRPEALRALADRIERREAARGELREAVEAIRADAKDKGLDQLSDDEVSALVKEARASHRVP